MKKEVAIEDATPSKNIFRSIIADYDAEIALCELIDNAIDIWNIKNKKFPLEISIDIDTNQQTIKIIDNAGGIRRSELDFIISPGKSLNKATDAIIGIFGVGSKRAVVALSQHVTIKSRYKNEDTYSVEITEEWLDDPSWDFAVYQVSNISPGSTSIEMTKLREALSKDDIRNIELHLSAIYAKFLSNDNLSLKLNGTVIKPILFDNIWSYNPTVPPQAFSSQIILDGETVNCTISAGLITEGGDSGYGEYGVYVYCNDRLISRALKTFDVGFTKGKVGVPHNSISLARVIIELNGPSRLMPWNSSKSGIDSKHKLFLLTRNSIIETIKHYASASRALFPEREEKIKPYKTGSITVSKDISVAQIDKSRLPPIPKFKKNPSDKIREMNQSLANSDPWIVGAYESIIASNNLLAKKFETRNRMILILVDSSIEIVFKDYLTYKVEAHFSNTKLKEIFEKRHNVINEVKKHCGNLIEQSDWNQLSYFYGMRCDLIHQKNTADILQSDIHKFMALAKRIHKKLLGIRYPTE